MLYSLFYQIVHSYLIILYILILPFTDEFKGDSGNNKYQTSLLNGDIHSVIDILLSRSKDCLFEYFILISVKQ